MSVEVTMQHGYLLCAYMSDLLWQQMGLQAVGGGVLTLDQTLLINHAASSH